MARILDTHQVIIQLQKQGFSEAQAEGVIGAIKEVAESGLASKSDVSEIKTSIAKLEGMLKVLSGLVVGIVLLVIGLYIK